MGNLIHGARVNGYSSGLYMRLRADAIEFVLDKELVGHCPRDVSEVSGWSRKHELDWMKQPHAYVLKIVSARPHSGFADVTEQHVYLGHSCERALEGPGNGILN